MWGCEALFRDVGRHEGWWHGGGAPWTEGAASPLPLPLPDRGGRAVPTAASTGQRQEAIWRPCLPLPGLSGRKSLQGLSPGALKPVRTASDGGPRAECRGQGGGRRGQSWAGPVWLEQGLSYWSRGPSAAPSAQGPQHTDVRKRVGRQGLGTRMGTGGVLVAADPFLSTLPAPGSPSPSACRFGHARSRPRPRPSSLGADPLCTNWPECGQLGLGTVPTDTASGACLALGGVLTPVGPWLHCACQDGPDGRGGHTAVPAGHREAKEPPHPHTLRKPRAQRPCGQSPR